MNGSSESQSESKKRLPHWLSRTVIAVILAAVAIGGWMVYRGVAVSLQAENTLQATISTIQLVEQYVRENHRWPKSWKELEQVRFSLDPSWPATSASFQQRVSIDFQIDPKYVAEQDQITFSAIKPIGPCYPYQDYPYVPALQKAIKETLRDTPDTTPR